DSTHPLSALAVPADAQLASSKRPDVLGGVVVVSGQGLASAEPRWEGALYRPGAAPRPVPFIAVPYYAWDNRAPGPMEVWLPTAPPSPRLAGPETVAKVSISYKSDICYPEAI